ncbi:MAG: Transcriptional regulators of sugar metabolism [Parcubacteria bacterium C7867-003]|nr:MAG: Transcriptional regulators of sugar metabolism [Parcubacteria bacterium C7867-003]
MKYTTLASKEIIERTTKALAERNVEAIFVETKEKALDKIIELIPEGASIMNGASKTLEQVGFVDFLKSGEHKWNNLHEAILAEKDPAKQAELRKNSVLSDFYLGSVHGLAETGEFIIASNTGSQLSHIVFTSQNLILVASTKKISPTLKEATERLYEHVVPLEDERMMGVYGAHTQVNKIVVFNGENPMYGRKVRIILVNEDLGF